MRVRGFVCATPVEHKPKNNRMEANPAPTRYMVEVEHVKEVILTGIADLAFWVDHLHGSTLFPFSQNGEVLISISATDLVWKGARFNELTIAIPVCRGADARAPDGQYLVHAFNSSSLFACIERTLFKTPYHHGRIRVTERVPACIQLSDAHGPSFNAAMSGARLPARVEDELWEGSVHLPGSRAGSSESRRLFYARLGGHTETYPFVPSTDSLDLNPRGDGGVFQWLRDSHFSPREWRIRNNASHSKSKTYQSSLLKAGERR